MIATGVDLQFPNNPQLLSFLILNIQVWTPCFVVNSELENTEYFEANVAHSLSQADYFSCVGTIVHLRKENCMYQACPSQDCNKKVIDQQNGLYRCEKCDREFPNFKYRMMLLVSELVRAGRASPCSPWAVQIGAFGENRALGCSVC